MSSILEIILWCAIGALPGFYVFFLRSYNTFLGVGIGATTGFLVGFVGMELGLISTPLSAVVTIISLVGIALLLMPNNQYANPDITYQRRALTAVGGVALVLFLMAGISELVWFGRNIRPEIITIFALIAYVMVLPRGNYIDQQTRTHYIGNLAYALFLPILLIVLGIVIFPVIWNVLFSFRPIETADLPDLEVFSLEGFTFDNYVAQGGFRVDTVPCVRTEDGSGCLEEDGQIVYEDARRFFDDYRGFREVEGIDRGEERIAIGVRNPDFYPMLRRTLAYTFTSTILAILFGLIAALVVREAFPGRQIFRGFILFPYVAPVISVAFVWNALLRESGLVNAALGTSINFLGTRDSFLGVSIPLIMVIFFQTWRYFPFAFLFLLARIQAIPDVLYEAAKVDGATPLRRMQHITLPQLRAVLGTLFLLRFIWTFNKFDDIFLLTGAISQTKVIPIQIFEALFIESNVGEASAIAVVMAAILSVILLIYFRFFLTEEAEEA